MATAQKKRPERRCSGCGERREKQLLIRVVRAPDGGISLDKTGKKSGRGAYICPSADCLKKARKAKRLESALETQIPDSVYDALEKELSGNG